jgi:hypothetical protein
MTTQEKREKNLKNLLLVKLDADEITFDLEENSFECDYCGRKMPVVENQVDSAESILFLCHSCYNGNKEAGNIDENNCVVYTKDGVNIEDFEVEFPEVKVEISENLVEYLGIRK